MSNTIDTISRWNKEYGLYGHASNSTWDKVKQLVNNISGVSLEHPYFKGDNYTIREANDVDQSFSMSCKSRDHEKERILKGSPKLVLTLLKFRPNIQTIEASLSKEKKSSQGFGISM